MLKNLLLLTELRRTIVFLKALISSLNLVLPVAKKFKKKKKKFDAAVSGRSQLSKQKAGIPARMPKPEAGPPPPGVRDAPPRLLNRGATSFPFPKLRNAVRCLHDTLPEDETYDALEPPKVPQSHANRQEGRGTGAFTQPRAASHGRRKGPGGTFSSFKYAVRALPGSLYCWCFLLLTTS